MTPPIEEKPEDLSALPDTFCSPKGERDIPVTVYITKTTEMLDTLDIEDRGIGCVYIGAYELKRRHFVIGTDAEASDEECAARFVDALKASGMNVEKYELNK